MRYAIQNQDSHWCRHSVTEWCCYKNTAHWNILHPLTSKAKELECVTVPFGKMFVPVQVYIPSSLSETDKIFRVLSFVRLLLLTVIVWICSTEEGVNTVLFLDQKTWGEGFPVTLQLTTRLSPKSLVSCDGNWVTITASANGIIGVMQKITDQRTIKISGAQSCFLGKSVLL